MRVPQRIGANVNHDAFKRTHTHAHTHMLACMHTQGSRPSGGLQSLTHEWMGGREKERMFLRTRLGVVFAVWN